MRARRGLIVSLALALLAASLVAGCLALEEPCMHYGSESEWLQPGLYALFPKTDSAGFNVTLSPARGEPFAHPEHGDIVLSAVRFSRGPGVWGSPFQLSLNATASGADRVEIVVTAVVADEEIRQAFIDFMAPLSTEAEQQLQAWADHFISSRTHAGYERPPFPIPIGDSPPDDEAVDRLRVHVSGPYRFDAHHTEVSSERFVRGSDGLTMRSGGSGAGTWSYIYSMASLHAARAMERNETAHGREAFVLDDRDHVFYHLTPPHLFQQEGEFAAVLHEAFADLGLPAPPSEAIQGSMRQTTCR